MEFDIPLSPTKEIVMSAMASTHSIYSQYSADQILDLCDIVISDTAQNVFKIMDAFYVSCYASASPFCECLVVASYSLLVHITS